LTKDKKEALDKIMLQDAKKHGLDSLPES
jgi:hypothetical protein